MLKINFFCFPSLVSSGLLAVVCLGLTGCGETDGTYQVQGKMVFLDGTPAGELAGFGVMLESVELIDGKTISSSGVIGPNGEFSVGTFSETDGALPGKYRVSITPFIPLRDDAPQPKRVIDFVRYGSFGTSKLKMTIEPNAQNPVELKVERLSANR